jgi:putative methanogenesis marker protein 3
LTSDIIGKNVFSGGTHPTPERMKLKVNGREVEVQEGSVLGDVIRDEPYHPGSFISIVRSSETIMSETNEFELLTSEGPMVLHLTDNPLAKRWREYYEMVKGNNVRWQTSKVLAIGSFPTDLEVSRGQSTYKRYDCFLSLGGFDNQTTYLMIAKQDHVGRYGVDQGRIGRITRGRHVLEDLDEGESIEDIRPVVLELSSQDAYLTSDLAQVLDDGMIIDTYVEVDLDEGSPVSAEHFLVASGKGHIPVTDDTFSYLGCSTHMDVSLVKENVSVREPMSVTVRNDGVGQGRIYIYRDRRQISEAHNLLGKVVQGKELVRLARKGMDLTVVPRPKRALAIGMTQAEGEEFLAGFGLKQVRTGDTSDGAMVVEQEPDLTLIALRSNEVETFGVPKEKVFAWEMFIDQAPNTVHYIRKMTGLDHKPVGTLRVHFTYPGFPMITFEGNEKVAKSLGPENPFDGGSKKMQVGVTNQVRPHRGLIGIRLDDSPEFGPTGEEPYGTNIAGRFMSDPAPMLEGIKEGDIVYIMEVDGE